MAEQPVSLEGGGCAVGQTHWLYGPTGLGRDSSTTPMRAVTLVKLFTSLCLSNLVYKRCDNTTSLDGLNEACKAFSTVPSYSAKNAALGASVLVAKAVVE